MLLISHSDLIQEKRCPGFFRKQARGYMIFFGKTGSLSGSEGKKISKRERNIP